ncbi:MAG: SUF system Fe-S cluster assembly regulator [Gammaproteobacteria bacterium]
MLRMSRMTDYGTVVLATLAGRPGEVFSAVDVAEATQLNEPTVKKILKTLTKADLVESFRGQQGGYALKGAAHDISAARILDALEGPVALTECSAELNTCQIQSCCTVGRSWQIINHQIRTALETVTLDQLLQGGPVALNDLQFNLSMTASAG